MAISDVANALANDKLTGQDANPYGAISSTNVAVVSATLSGGQWTVTSEVAWESSRFLPPTWLFDNPTSTSIDVAQQKNGGNTAFTSETILAYDGNNVLLGQPDGSGGFAQFYLVSDTTLNPATTTVTFPITDMGTTGSYTPPPAVSAAPCFLTGTHIRTTRGEVAVEELIAGDTVLVKAAEGTAQQKVVWVGRRRVNIGAHPDRDMVRPIRISRDAFARDEPMRDLLVSPDHAIYVDGMLIPAKLLVNGGSIVQDRALTEVEYFHVELPEHSVLFSENLPTESYLDTGNRTSFENSGKLVTQHPDFSLDARLITREAHSCLPFVVAPSVLDPVWRRLASRASSLGWTVPAIETTSEPALYLQVAGRHIRPLVTNGTIYTFALPHGVGDLRLMSRAARPCDARPWIDDRRTLGVSISRIRVRDGSEVADIALDGPVLGDGWWDVEFDGTSVARWTTGNALLRLAPVEKLGRMLELTLASTMTYPVEPASRSLPLSLTA